MKVEQQIQNAIIAQEAYRQTPESMKLIDKMFKDMEAKKELLIIKTCEELKAKLLNK